LARHAHEFNCTNCGWFNYPMLSDSLSGNYTIRCGHCNHEHYRVILDGVVTEDRHDKARGAAEVIHVMPSACSKEPQKKGLVAQLRELAAAGLAE
jgi:hypothetical protein